MPARLPVLLLLLLSTAGRLCAQPVPDTLDAAAADVLEHLTVPPDAPEALAEWLEALRREPADPNTASAETLARLPGLSLLLAYALVAERAAHGPFVQWTDLLRVPGLTAARLAEARPYLSLASQPRSAPSRASGPRTRLRPALLTRVTRRNLDDGPRYYTRLRATSRHLHFNLTMEQDPGEPLQWHPERRLLGADHVTAHVSVAEVGRLEQLVLGDYALAYGQGLALWRHAAFGKGAAATDAFPRLGRGVVPYGATEENRFFRGLALTARLRAPVYAAAFASRRRRDATLDSLAATPVIRSLGTSGLHRSPGEQARRDAVREELLGGALTFHGRRLQLGAVHYQARFSAPFAPTDAHRSVLPASGRRAAMTSLFGHLRLRRSVLFGEAARATHGAVAWQAGVLTTSPERAELALVARRYPSAFRSLYGEAFGERNGATTNETGVYLGVRWSPAAAWSVQGYVDHYRFPAPRHDLAYPGTGRDALARVAFQPRRWLAVHVTARAEARDAAGRALQPSDASLQAVGLEARRSVRIQARYDFNPALRWTTQWEGTVATGPGAPRATGRLLYQDLRWQPRPAVRLSGRLSVYRVTGYAARIWAYEHDLRYTFTVPAFQGQGYRVYGLLSWAPRPRLRWECKYAVSVQEGQPRIAHELRFQVAWNH